MALPTNVTPGTWTLDNSHSEIAFTVRHAGISKVRGQFTDAAATLDLAENVADQRHHPDRELRLRRREP